MVSRLFVVFLVLLLFGGSASAGMLNALNDPALTDSVKEFKKKNYAFACDIASKAHETPVRNFLLGIYSYKLEKWSDAAESFTKSIVGFDLLADYSLYYLSDSLFRLGRYTEAEEALRKLRKEYSASPLIKSAAFLNADTLFRKNDFAGAMAAYLKYVESYPSGAKALQAIYQTALCREALGDKESAAGEFRRIWLRYPGSQLALQVEKDLARLKAENIAVAPYTGEEIYERGVILYDLKKYKQAIQTFNSLSAFKLPENLKSRIKLKTGLSLFNARQYGEATKILSGLTSHKDAGIASESAYWLARTLYRSKKESEAIAWYNRVAEVFPKSVLADDALFHSAMAHKYMGENNEAVAILEKLVSSYPSSLLAPKALWEDAWIRYLARDFKGSATILTQLLDNPSYREKALYWLGKAEEALGEADQAKAVFAKLNDQYPFGYYASQRQSSEETRKAPVNSDAASSIPVPAGYDRVKALMALGLTDEAATELAAFKSKTSSRTRLLEIARLYWEMQDYRMAMGLFRNMGGIDSPEWNFCYPTAFSEHVSRYAGRYGVSESLAYSIMRAESNFYPSARSAVGAVGLMQIMPNTAKYLEKDKSGIDGEIQLTHPELNIKLGMKHLKDLIRRYQGNLVFAVAAYNSGATPVDRWRRNFSGLEKDEFIENIPYPETREYVKKVFSSMSIYKSLYGLDSENGKTAATGISNSTADTPRPDSSSAE